MPSHRSKKTAALAVKSDGTTVSHADWRANRIADAMAKIEAARWLPPKEVLDDLKKGSEAAMQVVTRLAEVTFVAGHFKSEVPNGNGDTTLLRDCCPPRMRGKFARWAQPKKTATRGTPKPRLQCPEVTLVGPPPRAKPLPAPRRDPLRMARARARKRALSASAAANELATQRRRIEARRATGEFPSLPAQGNAAVMERFRQRLFGCNGPGPGV